MASTSRETARDALVALLTTELVGDGLPVKTVQGSKLATLEAAWPAVIVLSDGSERESLTFQGDRAIFYFRVQVFMHQSETGWTVSQAEDALDRIEALIADVYADNDGTSNWEVIRQNGRTEIMEVSVEGVPCYLENIPTVVVLGRS